MSGQEEEDEVEKMQQQKRNRDMWVPAQWSWEWGPQAGGIRGCVSSQLVAFREHC